MLKQIFTFTFTPLKVHFLSCFLGGFMDFLFIYCWNGVKKVIKNNGWFKIYLHTYLMHQYRCDTFVCERKKPKLY